MRKALLTSGALLVLSGCIFGQENITFEVASVKPSPPPQPGGPVFLGPARGGPGTSDPGQITWQNAALLILVSAAYDKQLFQVTAPDWMAMERFDFIVRVPAGATKEQVNVMWQNLLKDRFGMVVHHESKEFQVDELSIAKGGPKVKDTALPANAEPFSPAAGPPKFDKDGFPEMNGSGAITFISINNGSPLARTVAKGFSMGEFAARLGQMLRHPVIDKTGLTGRYDFNLEFTMDPASLPPPPPLPGGGAPPPPPPPAAAEAVAPGSTIESAVEKQLGLKLTKSKAPLDVIVVDHAERTPTAN